MSMVAGPKSTKAGYDVPRPGGQCSVCGNPIAAGEKFFAAVREIAEGLERLDISLDCWNGFDRSALLGFWQAVMPAKGEEKKKLFVDDQTLCALFERLGDAQEPLKVQFRFVLGLVLMRKRLVVYEGSRRDADHDVWIVRMKGKEEKLDLIDPKLTEQQVAEVSGQLGQILSDEM
jgi:hypothetical protein